MSNLRSITARHLERLAVVYIRQSSLAQVRENTESTARQYALAAEAARLGWEASKILTIDSDLGLSGRSACGRDGFKELVSRVCLGEVGAILGLEVSRLARSSADLQRLIEFCSLTDTLIIDADGVYDLQVFNDRLLLGLKGTMSEAELHILAGRLQESKRAAARRGELRFPLPVGYVYDDDGRTVMDANEEIRAAVADVFSSFEATGSAYGVVACFRERRFPRRAYGGVWSGEVRWGRLTHSRVLSLLSNPAYAGAYVFGRFRSRRSVDPDGTIRTKTAEVAREQWSVVLKDHHPAYIGWDAFLANERRLAANHTRSGSRPPREGAALLQGMVACGCCGRAMSTIYSSGRASYDCSHSRSNHTKTPGCRAVVASFIDEAVGERMLAAVVPEQITLALAAAEEVTARRQRSTRALELQVERARYEAARAERAFHRCEPENRLVARSLEQRWEEKLLALGEAEATLASSRAAAVPLPPPGDLVALATDLPRLWAAPTTSAKDRKRLLRTLAADVTLISEPGPQVRVGIRWRTGATEELVVFRSASRRTPAAAIELVTRLSERSEEELVAELAAAGLATGAGRPFDIAAVRWMRYAHQIPAAPRSLLAPGELTVAQVATRLAVVDDVVYYWISCGQLDARRGAGGRLCVPFSPDVEEACRKRVLCSTRIKPRTQTTAGGGAI
ncbi:MAG TPA: recombinase family protein [Thermoanaerobaculia bacterium]|nr:recombinase family protein [Thermoanaerobaculia bacterium]